MKLRRASAGDVDEIADVFRRARTVSLPFLPVLHTEEEEVAFFEGIVLTTQTVVVAEAERAVAGFIAYDDSWVHHLYLAPEAQGRGWGGRLLADAQATCSALQLWCFQENWRARAFYARYGFREVRFSDGSGNEERVPDLLLAWRRGSS